MYLIIIGLVAGAYIMIFYDILKDMIKLEPLEIVFNADVIGVKVIAGVIAVGIGLVSTYFLAWKKI